MHTYWECSKIVCYPCPITQLFNMQDNKGTYRESSGQCAIQLWILKKKIYGYNIYLPFTTQERHQNTYKSVFTINLHEIFMQYNTQVLLLVWGENAPPLKARASSLLDVTKSWMPVLAIECIDRLTPKIPQPAAGVDVPRELFTPPPLLIPLPEASGGDLQHLQAIVYVKRIFCHMDSKGSEAGPWYWKKKSVAILCKEIMGFILFHSHIHRLHIKWPLFYWKNRQEQ